MDIKQVTKELSREVMEKYEVYLNAAAEMAGNDDSFFNDAMVRHYHESKNNWQETSDKYIRVVSQLNRKK